MKYIIVAHQPACSAVLLVNPKLEPAHRITILTQDTHYACIAYAAGFAAGAGMSAVQHRGTVDLPAGNSATRYRVVALGEEMNDSQPNPAEPKFVAIGPSVLQGARTIARAISKTMAKRIANALNKHVPNKEGV